MDHALWGEVCVSCPQCLGKRCIINFVHETLIECDLCEGKGYVEIMVEYPLEEL
jgi:hypothetical protein